MKSTSGNYYHVLLFVAAWLLVVPLHAQDQSALEVPQVPETIRFANMTLHLTDQARRDIQADVNALYRSPKYFYMKLERVDMYLPIIEPIFAEQGIPDDLKYLVIQESALISDAISSSNAVGFWQFKESSATEVGMRVDRQVDERMNIVSSTIGAAKYLNRSNATFDNWLYSLQSYQMGLGGASRAVNQRHYGAREMKIEGNTYWYVKKFLSHLVAFRDAVGKQPRNLMLYQHKNTANRDLQSIASEFNADPELLAEYNKWLKDKRVPDDKPYVVIVPLRIDEAPNLLASGEEDQPEEALEDQLFGEKQKEPAVPAIPDRLVITKVNGIQAIVARPGDKARDLAKAGEISIAKFLKFNEISPGEALQPGQVYYLKRKKKKASVYRHVLAEGETLWEVSQKYGVRLDRLLQKNRLRHANAVKPGQVIWLRYIRPANQAIAYETPPKRKVAASQPATRTQAAEQKIVEQKKVAQQPVLQASAGTSQPAQQPVPPQKDQTPLPTAPQEALLPAEQTPRAAKPTAEALQPDGAAVPTAATSQQAEREKKAVTQPAIRSVKVEEQVKSAQPSAAAVEKLFVETTPSQVSVAADTPVVRKVQPSPVQKNGHEPDTVLAPEAEVQHMYPGAGNAQRNVLEENKENRGRGSASAVTARPRTDPDSFGVHGPVRFLGEEDALATQPPLPLPDSPTLKTGVEGKSQPVLTPQQPAEDSVHVVQAGETLYSISRKWNLSVQELRKRNNMNEQAVLSIGQVLKLHETKTPAPEMLAQASATDAAAITASATQEAQQEDGTIYHTVTEGETMYRVARKYNVTIKDIMEWNKKDDFNIRPGEVLVVNKK